MTTMSTLSTVHVSHPDLLADLPVANAAACTASRRSPCRRRRCCAPPWLEMDHRGAAREFVAAVGRFPVCGFHTYGESYVGHINQTLTGLLIA
jgi:hypothetical protein